MPTNWIDAHSGLIQDYLVQCDENCLTEPELCTCNYYIQPDTGTGGTATPAGCELKQQLAQIEENGHWNRGRPDAPGEYLISGCGYVGLVYFDGQQYDWQGQPMPKCPMTHWMPKPEAAKFPAQLMGSTVSILEKVTAAMSDSSPSPEPVSTASIIAAAADRLPPPGNVQATLVIIDESGPLDSGTEKKLEAALGEMARERNAECEERRRRFFE